MRLAATGIILLAVAAFTVSALAQVPGPTLAQKQSALWNARNDDVERIQKMGFRIRDVPLTTPPYREASKDVLIIQVLDGGFIVRLGFGVFHQGPGKNVVLEEKSIIAYLQCDTAGFAQDEYFGTQGVAIFDGFFDYVNVSGTKSRVRQYKFYRKR